MQSYAQVIPFAFWKNQTLFVWMGGNSQNVQQGNYGIQGTGSTTNSPGIRSEAVNWIDASGNLWVFGGNGYDANGVQDLLNDLWEYTPSTGKWTWVTGLNAVDQQGYYGTKGTGSAANIPGARSGATSWIDGSGNFWCFGGAGFDSADTWGYLNDLWEYIPASGTWTWVSGAKLKNTTGHYGTKGTGSTNNYPGSRSGASSWIDSSGNFWIFGGFGADSTGSFGELNDLWEYTPGNNKWTWISGSNVNTVAGVYGTKGTGSTANFPGSRDSSVSWMDGSGNLWLFSGHGYDSTTSLGLMNDAWEFTPSNKNWTWVAGSTLVGASGSYGTEGTGSTSNIPGARQYSAGFKDGSGNFWLFGGLGIDSAHTTGPMNDLWEFNSATLAWTWVSGNTLASQTGVYGTQGTGSTSNIPGSRQGLPAWVDASGNFWFFGGYGVDRASNARLTHLNDLWEYTPSSGKWNWLNGAPVDLQQGTFGTLGSSSTSYLPSGRDSSNTWVDTSGNLYLFGGFGPDKLDQNTIGIALNDFWRFSPSTQQWTWLSGSNTAGFVSGYPNGIYGTQGTGSTSNLPGGRGSAAHVVDASGNFWMFGGSGQDGTGANGDLNDLWKYNPTSSQWTWISGSSLANQSATYGTLGTGSTSNIPGPRDSSVAWIDASGNFWLFGGYGKDSVASWGFLSDLWEFNPTSLQWTWVSGPNTVNQKGTYGTEGTGATSNIPGGRQYSAAWLDTSGNLWLFGGIGYDSAGSGGSINDLWKYNPSNSQWTWVAGSNVVGAGGTYGTQRVASGSNIPGARYGMISWRDGGGNFWLMGGNADDSSDSGVVANDVWKYTPANNQWTWVAGASLGTPSGVYGTLGVASSMNAPGGRQFSQSWYAPDGSVWIFGGQGIDAFGNQDYMNDLWKLTP